MNAFTKKPFEGLSKNVQDLYRIIALASGLGLGAMLALSQAVRIKDGSFSLEFSVITAITFVVGFAATYTYLSRILTYLECTSRLFVRGGLIVIMFLVLAAFIYPLRFSIDQLAQRLEGVAIALGVIATGLTLVRSVVRAAEREEAEQEAKEHKSLSAPSAQTSRTPILGTPSELHGQWAHSGQHSP